MDTVDVPQTERSRDVSVLLETRLVLAQGVVSLIRVLHNASLDSTYKLNEHQISILALLVDEMKLGRQYIKEAQQQCRPAWEVSSLLEPDFSDILLDAEKLRNSLCNLDESLTTSSKAEYGVGYEGGDVMATLHHLEERSRGILGTITKRIHKKKPTEPRRDDVTTEQRRDDAATEGRREDDTTEGLRDDVTTGKRLDDAATEGRREDARTERQDDNANLQRKLSTRLQRTEKNPEKIVHVTQHHHEKAVKSYCVDWFYWPVQLMTNTIRQIWHCSQNPEVNVATSSLGVPTTTRLPNRINADETISNDGSDEDDDVILIGNDIQNGGRDVSDDDEEGLLSGNNLNGEFDCGGSSLLHEKCEADEDDDDDAEYYDALPHSSTATNSEDLSDLTKKAKRSMWSGTKNLSPESKYLRVISEEEAVAILSDLERKANRVNRRSLNPLHSGDDVAKRKLSRTCIISDVLSTARLHNKLTPMCAWQ